MTDMSVCPVLLLMHLTAETGRLAQCEDPVWQTGQWCVSVSFVQVGINGIDHALEISADIQWWVFMISSDVHQAGAADRFINVDFNNF